VLVVEDVELVVLVPWRACKKASKALAASVPETPFADPEPSPWFFGGFGAFFIRSVKADLAAERSPEFKALSKAERSGPLDLEDFPETLDESSESPSGGLGPFFMSVCNVENAVLAAERSPEVKAFWRFSKSSPIFPPPFLCLVEVELRRLVRSLLDETLDMLLIWSYLLLTGCDGLEVWTPEGHRAEASIQPQDRIGMPEALINSRASRNFRVIGVLRTADAAIFDR
jgi:hypothetical protein